MKKIIFASIVFALISCTKPEPTKPFLQVEQVGELTVKLNWTHFSDNVLNVYIYRDNELMFVSDSGNTYIDSTVNYNSYYVYYIKEETPSRMVWSEQVGIKIPEKPKPATLATPENFRSTRDFKNMKLEWDEVSGAEKYGVSDGNTLKETSGNTIEFNQLFPNVGYIFSIIAVNQDTFSVAATLTDTTRGLFTASWSHNQEDNISHYQLFNFKDGEMSMIQDLITDTTFQFVVDSPPCVSATAVNDKGLVSELSDIFCVEN